jgi:hypothetical protein
MSSDWTVSMHGKMEGTFTVPAEMTIKFYVDEGQILSVA